jgi:drug/metabolite transporter (DMT)-like permease
VPGVALVVGGVPSGMHDGIVVGAISAFLVAIFGSLNKRLVEHGDPLTLTGLELGAGAITLALLSPLVFAWTPAFGTELWVVPDTRDAILLVILALACTLLPFALAFVALRHMSAFAAQLAINLEPVYAIALAVLLLDEQRELTPQFYLGVAVIVAAVLVHPKIARRRAPSPQPELLCTAESKGVAE